MSNLSFLLLFCILLVTSPLYSNANKKNYGEFRFINSKDGKLIDYDTWDQDWPEGVRPNFSKGNEMCANRYHSEDYNWSYGYESCSYFCWIATFLEEISNFRKCLGNSSLIWNEKYKFFTLFSNGQNNLTFKDGRLSLKENSSVGINFAIANGIMIIEKNNLCGPKAEIHLYGKKNCVLIVQNNVSLARVIFNQSKEIYELKGLKSNIQVLYISHYFKYTRFVLQYLPRNLNDSTFLAISFPKQDKVLLGVPLCGSIIGVNETCFLEFDSVMDMYLKMESLKEDKLNHDEFLSKSTLSQTLDNNYRLDSEDEMRKVNKSLKPNNQGNDDDELKNKINKTELFNENVQEKSKKSNKTNLPTQNNFILNAGSNKTDVIEIPPNSNCDEKIQTLKIVLIVIGSLLSAITIILFGVFIKIYYFKTHKPAVPVPANNNGLVFKKYSSSDI